MNFDLQALSSFSGWEQLAQVGMSFGTNLLAALAIFFIGRWIAARVGAGHLPMLLSIGAPHA